MLLFHLCEEAVRVMKHTEMDERERIGSGGTSPRDWIARSRRRWPIAIGILVVLLIAVVAVARRGGADRTSEGAGSVEQPAGAARTEEATDSVVTLDSVSLGLVEIRLVPVGGAGNNVLVANGAITYDANRVSVVAPRTDGRVVEVKTDLGMAVSAGAVLALVESREVGQTRGELERARVSVEVTKLNYEREKRLYEQSISSQKEMLEAEGAYKTAVAEYDGATAQISGLGAQGGRGGVYRLTSPLAGTVVERNAMPGQVIDPSTNLFTVANLERVWITVDVYEGDIARVRKGAVAMVRPRSLPGETFRGRVTYAGGVIDTASRTLKVRVEVDNPGLRLRPGMFAQVEIEASQSGAAPAPNAPIVIPELAVQDLNGQPVVFVPNGGRGRYVARRVTVGTRTGSGFVTITNGLRIGDTVVTTGSFQLKSELTKGSFAGDDS